MKTTASTSLRFRIAPAAETPRADRRPLALALLLIAALAAFRLAYLAWLTPLELAPDEAHYWDWSRHLDWSYYSKGPLVAWLIRLSCTLCGGDTALAVRLPAVLCGALTSLGLYVLTNRAYGRPWLAFAAIGLASLLPLFHVGALLMTIDAPFVCAWTWALVVAQRATQSTPLARGGAWRWIALGLLIGLGILAKYTMILFPLSLVGFCLISKEQRGWFRKPGPYVMALVAALCCLPIVMWNFEHGWVTLRHVGGQAGFAAEEFGKPAEGLRWLGLPEYLGGQALLLMGFGFVVWLMAMTQVVRHLFFKSAIRNPQSAIDTFFACMSLPTFLVFLAFSVKTKVQLNWPLAAYLAGLPLCVKWLADAWTTMEGWRGRLLRRSAIATAALALLLSIAIHQTEWLYPLLGRYPDKLPARKWDPTCKLRGWATLAAEVQRLREELRGQGIEPVIAGTTWFVPGEIGFYLPDQPSVVCLGQLGGDRQSQYDFWPPHPAHQPEAFGGRTLIIVGWAPKKLWTLFDHVEPTEMVTHEVQSQPAATWPVTVARGFRGRPTR